MANTEKKARIMIGKVGCDIHERGALTMMNVYRDAGMEVIYTGRYQSEAAVAMAAINEDVDVLSISDLSGNLPSICEKILAVLKENGSDIPLTCGGLMTPKDREDMKAMGVKESFPTGSEIDYCLKRMQEIIAERQAE